MSLNETERVCQVASEINANVRNLTRQALHNNDSNSLQNLEQFDENKRLLLLYDTAGGSKHEQGSPPERDTPQSNVSFLLTKFTLKEETFAVSRFLAKSAKVYSREIFHKTSSAKVSSHKIF